MSLSLSSNLKEQYPLLIPQKDLVFTAFCARTDEICSQLPPSPRFTLANDLVTITEINPPLLVATCTHDCPIGEKGYCQSK